MALYLLSVWHDGTQDLAATDEADMQRMFAQVDAFNTEVKEAGKWVFAGGLHGPESSTVVDASGAQPVLTDGLFAETKEYLGGFWVIESDDLDEALTWAAKGSAACEGKVEVRPFQGDTEA